jgi:hypothetical protein
MNETIKASFGLDSTAFVAGLDKANVQASRFKQRLEGILGPGLLRGAGIAAIGSTLAVGLLNASRRAAEMADEMERAGKAVDQSLRDAGELSRYWDGIAKSVASLPVALLKAAAARGARIGPGLAQFIYGDEQVRNAERSERDAAAAVRRLAEARELQQFKKAADEEAERNLMRFVSMEYQRDMISRRIRAIMVEQSQITGDDFASKKKILELDRERLKLVGEEDKLTERINANREKQAENTRRIADLTANIETIQSNAEAAQAQVGIAQSRAPSSIEDIIGVGSSGGMGGRAQVDGGGIPRYIGDMTRTQFREAQRIAEEETRATRAEMRGNTDRAAQIRQANARRAERDFPGVREGNETARQSISDQAAKQVEQLGFAVDELNAINTKLEQG